MSSSVITLYLVSQTLKKRLICHKTKGFHSVMKFSFDSSGNHSNLDFETEFTRIGYGFIEIHQFQNWQAGFNFQNFARIFRVLIFTMFILLKMVWKPGRDFGIIVLSSIITWEVCWTKLKMAVHFHFDWLNDVKRGRRHSNLVFPYALNGRKCTCRQRKRDERHTTIPFHELPDWYF